MSMVVHYSTITVVYCSLLNITGGRCLNRPERAEAGTNHGQGKIRTGR